jgi:phthiodiolone/phenolphthiodiolone dimycocerosates ketoreductase
MAKAKCGPYNLQFANVDAMVRYGKRSEAAGDEVMFFTDQMEGYFAAEDIKKAVGAGARGGPVAGAQMGMCDPAPVIPLVAKETKDIELFLGAVDTRRHVPSKLAQTFMTLDNATRGRSFFALGAGELKQLGNYGMTRKDISKRLADAMIIIRKMLDAPGEKVYYEGEYYSNGGGLLPTHAYGKTPPKFIATPGLFPIEYLGQYADGMLVSLKRYLGGAQQYSKDVKKIKNAAEKAGRDPEQLRFAAAVLTFMHDDPKELDRLAEKRQSRFYAMMIGADRGAHWKNFGMEHPLGDDWGYARSAAPGRLNGDQLSAAVDKVSVEAVKKIGFFSGSVEEVAEKLKPYVEGGLNYCGVVNYAGWAQPDLWEEGEQDRLKLGRILQAGF